MNHDLYYPNTEIYIMLLDKESMLLKRTADCKNYFACLSATSFLVSNSEMQICAVYRQFVLVRTFTNTAIDITKN